MNISDESRPGTHRRSGPVAVAKNLNPAQVRCVNAFTKDRSPPKSSTTASASVDKCHRRDHAPRARSYPPSGSSVLVGGPKAYSCPRVEAEIQPCVMEVSLGAVSPRAVDGSARFSAKWPSGQGVIPRPLFLHRYGRPARSSRQRPPDRAIVLVYAALYFLTRFSSWPKH